MALNTDQTLGPPVNEPRWRVWGCLALLLVGLHLAVGPKIMLSQWVVPRGYNAALDEALRWKQGTMALSDANHDWEAAEKDGKRYNVVGLPFVLLSLVGTTLTEWAGGEPGTFYSPYYVACVALPLPLAAFWAFRKVTGSSAWAAVLAAYLIAGTSLTPVLGICRSGSIYYINHALAVTGLLIMAGDLLGSRRIWPAVLGLCLAAWSRQMTCFYAVPLLWIAWRSDRPGAVGDTGEALLGSAAQSSRSSRADAAPPGLQRTAPPEPPRPTPGSPCRAPGSPHTVPPGPPSPADGQPGPTGRRRSHLRLWMAVAGVAFAAAVPMTLSVIKLGNPFETGYGRMYSYRGVKAADHIGRRGRECFLGLRYLPEHARAMNLSFPRWDIRAGTLYADATGINGASIWLTSPLLVGVFATAPRWWSDRRRRALVLTTVAVIAGLWCYHTTAAYDTAYYRYSLDFIPIWLMAISPYTMGTRGRPLTLACLAYSALYFNVVA